MAGRVFSRLETPLELADHVADMANQVARTPLRVVANVAGAVATAAQNLDGDVARPAAGSEIPPSPAALIEPVISGVSHVIDGAINTVKGAVDGVMATADGVRSELQQLAGR